MLQQGRAAGPKVERTAKMLKVNKEEIKANQGDCFKSEYTRLGAIMEKG
jgi:hypothetical protein